MKCLQVAHPVDSLNGSVASGSFWGAVFPRLFGVNGMIWFLTICSGSLRKHDKSFGTLCTIMVGLSGNGLLRIWRKPRMWPIKTSWTDLIWLGVSTTLLWPGVTLLSLGWIGHRWALFLDFHLSCADSPELVVFWVLLQLIFQFVPKKRKKKCLQVAWSEITCKGKSKEMSNKLQCSMGKLRVFNKRLLYLLYCYFELEYEGDSHTRLKAHDHCILRSLIGWKGRDYSSLFHNRRWGPEVPMRLSWMKSLHGFLHVRLWTMFHGLWEFPSCPPPRDRPCQLTQLVQPLDENPGSS